LFGEHQKQNSKGAGYGGAREGKSRKKGTEKGIGTTYVKKLDKIRLRSKCTEFIEDPAVTKPKKKTRAEHWAVVRAMENEKRIPRDGKFSEYLRANATRIETGAEGKNHNKLWRGRP